MLSTSVANGFKSLRDLNQMAQDTMETERFCRTFDKIFDLFNTRSLTECEKKRKPDLSPYCDEDDPRLDVSFCTKLNFYSYNNCSGWRELF